MSRAVLDHSDRSSVTAVEDNTVLLAQYLAAQQQQQQQSRYSGAGNASIHEELALLRAQQQLQQQQQPTTQEEYHLAAARRALALNSLGYGAPGAMGSLHQSPQLGSLGNAEVSQLELLLAQARFKAAMGSGGAGASPSQPGLILPTLAHGNGNNMGTSPYFGGASAGDTSALLQSANSRAALIHNILGLSSLGDGGDSSQQDALRRALLQSSLAGRRHL